jgi:hypothetical protein
MFPRMNRSRRAFGRQITIVIAAREVPGKPLSSNAFGLLRDPTPKNGQRPQLQASNRAILESVGRDSVPVGPPFLDLLPFCDGDVVRVYRLTNDTILGTIFRCSHQYSQFASTAAQHSSGAETRQFIARVFAAKRSTPCAQQNATGAFTPRRQATSKLPAIYSRPLSANPICR